MFGMLLEICFAFFVEISLGIFLGRDFSEKNIVETFLGEMLWVEIPLRICL